ncbi:MAG: hypothetical protein GTO14_22615 [Anaerolineales bacterium]|nr:hypothetical protein [Anaerolineales bacterium]
MNMLINFKTDLKRPTFLFLMLFAFGLATLACSEESVTRSVTIIDSELTKNLPESRSVLLGVQPFPHDISEEASDQAYDFMYEHSDLLFYHLDNGIPWPEALADEPYHPNFMEDIERMVARRKPGQPLYLAITPNQPKRNHIALYRGVDESMDLPPAWQGKSFDDHDVITAYLNHSRYMIETFDPDYFAYGIEVTCNFASADDPNLIQFLHLAEAVYPMLKQEYPDLPIFLTICTGSFEVDDINILFELGRRVLEYSDYVAVSTYPYWIVPGLKIKQANPDDLPRDWFAQWAELAPEKPFVVAETAYPAEDLKMTPVLGWRVDIEANEALQARYVAFMLEALNDLGAEFVAWFVPRDYDALYEWITEQIGEVEFYKTWRDTGFLDGDGNPRPALLVWDAWLAVPHE